MSRRNVRKRPGERPMWCDDLDCPRADHRHRHSEPHPPFVPTVGEDGVDRWTHEGSPTGPPKHGSQA
jgi:hypothetical protein